MKNIFQFIGTLILVLVSIPAILWLAKTFLYADVLERWSGRDVEGGLAVRFANWYDLLVAFGRAPTHWLQGLGFNAFSMVTTAGSKEEYPHNMFVEVFAEEGLVMFTLLVVILIRCFRDGLWLFRRFLDDPVHRASVSCLIALTIYYFLIANKQANLWGNGMMFMFLCMLSRLRRRTEIEDLETGFVPEAFHESAGETDEGPFEPGQLVGGMAR